MRKRKIGIALIIILFLTSTLLYIIFHHAQRNKDLHIENWAFYNYGQIVNGFKGIVGVDININKVDEIVNYTDNVIVGVVDTGVDMYSGILQGQLWINNAEVKSNGIDDDKNGYIDDYYGWDFYNNDESIYDDYLYDYHGTYISNIVLEVAPNVQVISSKFLSGTMGDSSDCVSAVQYAINRGAQIINCSWCFEEDELSLRQLVKKNSDILFICASSNYRLNLNENEIYPASYEYDNVISVMAIDNTGEMYDASGYGQKVTIAAPGKDIYVLLPENDQAYVSGTSVATAFVTGTVALMKAVNKGLKPKEIKDILVKSAKKAKTLDGLCEAEGYLDVYQALQYCK